MPRKKSSTKWTKRRPKTSRKDGIYYVEDIVGKRVSNGETAYLVKWRNYSHADNTWEPIDHLLRYDCADFIERYEHESRPPAPVSSDSSLLADARRHMSRADLKSATAALLELEQLCPDSPALAVLKADYYRLKSLIIESTKHKANRDYRSALDLIERAKTIATESPTLNILKAECLVMLARNGEAMEIANSSNSEADSLYILGFCFYYGDKMELAFECFERLAALSPDNRKAGDLYYKANAFVVSALEADSAIDRDQLNAARAVYTRALNIDSINWLASARFYMSRAIVGEKLGMIESALSDFSSAIKLNNSCAVAYARRAEMYMKMKRFAEAVSDYETLVRLNNTTEHNQLLDSAREELRKRSGKRCYYEVLGVERNATVAEIKRAYKSLAFAHHPDRHPNASDEQRKVEENRFKVVGQAYEVLGDPERRKLYDCHV